MHKLTAAILALFVAMRDVALKIRARLVNAHVNNLQSLSTRAVSDVHAAQDAKQKALDLYAFACKEIGEADQKVRETAAYVKAEAAKHGVAL